MSDNTSGSDPVAEPKDSYGDPVVEPKDEAQDVVGRAHEGLADAEAARDAVAATVAARFGRKAPQGFFGEVNLWLDERMTERTARSGKTARAKS